MVLSSVLVPVDDMDAAVTFLSEQMGMEPRITDGQRYTAFQPGAVALALLGKEERLMPQTTLGMRVDDLRQTLSRWEENGAGIVRPISQGPHELRAVVRIPGGLLVTLSQKNA